MLQLGVDAGPNFARPMVSYAQNFEDVMLARVFKEQQAGFYIDVGAWDDTIDSVTKHFYENGWRGINIEPVDTMFTQLSHARPRDINIRMAVLENPSEAVLYRIPETGLSTFNAAYAETHRTMGHTVLQEIVPVTSLAAVCADHVGNCSIDFLKIDTEGTESAVLKGGDWTRYRPRVIVVEATRPLSDEATHQEWEPYLLKRGYLAAYFDGLNRFYVREEERELTERFRVPPNVFDNFVSYRTVELQKQCADLEIRLASAMRKADAWDKWRSTFLGRVVSYVLG